MLTIFLQPFNRILQYHTLDFQENIDYIFLTKKTVT